jgi:Coenzyme PQQ synthesis protein D (PqqD)
MVDRHARLRVAKDVAAKVIDGEAVVLNLVNGMYYSTDGVGAAVWTLLDRAPTSDEIVDALVARYDVPDAEARADVERLVGELLRENLVVVGAPASDAPPRAEEHRVPTAPYQSPVLNSYRDMGDLLALDPPMPDLEDLTWKESDEPDDRRRP